jgi:hypothetical protein
MAAIGGAISGGPVDRGAFTKRETIRERAWTTHAVPRLNGAERRASNAGKAKKWAARACIEAQMRYGARWSAAVWT